MARLNSSSLESSEIDKCNLRKECLTLYQFLVYLVFNMIKMNKNTSISLGEYFDQFVKSRIEEGRYKNVSEVIRAGLRLLEEEENKAAALRHAIQEGIDSGIATDFDPKNHLETLKAEKKING